MPQITSSISARTGDVVRASTSSSCRQRLWFSTTRASRAGSGGLFNLGGLGASREAQYLSRERGIPRTEYNSNIHLIRSSEVDPFAPVPGSTRAAADKAAAEQHTRARIASALAGRRGQFAPDHATDGLLGGAGAATLEDQLQALRDELAEARVALLDATLKAERAGGQGGSEPSMTSHLLSTVIIITAVYFIAKDVSARFAGPPPKPSDALSGEDLALTGEVDEATAQRQRAAPLEEQVLAESGLTSFESHQPDEVVEPPRRSLLSGLFRART